MVTRIDANVNGKVYERNPEVPHPIPPIDHTSQDEPKKESAPGTGSTADILRAFADMGYTFRQNDLDDSIEVNERTLNDGIAAEMRCHMRDRGFKGMGAIEDAYTMDAYHNRYHPLKDFLGSLVWDDGNHIKELAAHFTSHDAPIVYKDGTSATVIHAFLKRFLIGAIAKVDQQAQNIVLTLAGPQGIGKSTVPAWLASRLPKDFFSDNPFDPDNKEIERRLARTFLWEVGELGATTRRADVSALKHRLTQAQATFRVPYGRHDVHKPTLTSFIGTVNPEGRGFLVDKTGDRRFAVVNIESINFDYATRIDPNQVWAQAVALYKAGEPWRLQPEEAATQEKINAEHRTEETIDLLMPSLFILEPGNDALRMAPLEVAEILFFKNYGSMDKCQKDAAAWLKEKGVVKRGNIKTWRGVRVRQPNEIEE